MKRSLLLLTLFFFLAFILPGQNLTVQNLLNNVRLDSLVDFVKQLTGEKSVSIHGHLDTIKSRHYQDPGNEKAFQFLKEQFIRFGYQVDSLQYSSTGKNLFAVLPGNKFPDKRFMLGAHYDNLPAQSVARGADDNASGSATVLEAARIFRNYNFPYTIVFALWDEEEPGLVGSAAYVATLGNANDTLLGYFNVDMLGWDGNNDSVADINAKNVAHSLLLADKSDYCNTAYNIGLNVHILNPGEESSDHARFWLGNYSAISIGEEHHTDFYPYWHTLGDSLAHFNMSFYQKCAKLAYATIADFAVDSVNVVGLKKQETFRNEFKIYPNPFTTQISILMDSQLTQYHRILIQDAMGKDVYDSNNRMPSFNISTEYFVPGVYSICIYNQSGVYVKKMVKY